MGEWISLMDYAMKKNVSLSTLRRHIKANKVRYRVENGRYLLFVEANDALSAARKNVAPARDEDFLMSQLQTKLKKAQEEIAELKTLIAFYEESLGFKTQSPGPAPATNRFDV